MATKFRCVGAKLEIADEAGTVFTKVPQVMSMDIPQATAEEIEMTDLDNDTGYREFIPSFKDGGEISFTLAYSFALHVTPADSIWKLFQDGGTRDMRVHLPSEAPGSDYTFPGFVKGCGPGPISPNDGLTLVGTIRVAGACDIVATPEP